MEQKSIGDDATGVAWIDKNNKILSIKRAIAPDKFMEENKEKLLGISSFMAIAHNRAATSNHQEKHMDKECHPFLSEDGKFVLLQNGTVTNYTYIMNYLKMAGHKFSSGIDSEVLLHMFEDILEHSENRVDAIEKFASVSVGNVLIMFDDFDLWGFIGSYSFSIIDTTAGVMIGSELSSVLDAIGKENIKGGKVYTPHSISGHVNIKLSGNKYTITCYGKWKTHEVTEDGWLPTHVTYCDYCKTAGQPCERYKGKDRCHTCFKNKVETPKTYSSNIYTGFGYGIERKTDGIMTEEEIREWRNSRSLALTKNETPSVVKSLSNSITQVVSESKTHAVCAYCLLVHDIDEIVVCNKCRSYYCHWDFTKHVCGEVHESKLEVMDWLGNLLIRKRTSELSDEQGEDQCDG